MIAHGCRRFHFGAPARFRAHQKPDFPPTTRIGLSCAQRGWLSKPRRNRLFEKNREKRLDPMNLFRDGPGTLEMCQNSTFMAESRGTSPHPSSMLRSTSAFGFAANPPARDSGGVRGFPGHLEDQGMPGFERFALQPAFARSKMPTGLAWA